METHSPDSELGKLHSQKTIAASNQRAKPAAASSKQTCWAGRARGAGKWLLWEEEGGLEGKADSLPHLLAGRILRWLKTPTLYNPRTVKMAGFFFPGQVTLNGTP